MLFSISVNALEYALQALEPLVEPLAAELRAHKYSVAAAAFSPTNPSHLVTVGSIMAEPPSKKQVPGIPGSSTGYSFLIVWDWKTQTMVSSNRIHEQVRQPAGWRRANARTQASHAHAQRARR